MANKKKYIDSLIERITSKSLHLINYYNGLRMFAVGTNIRDCLEELGLETAIKSSTRIDSFDHLLRLDTVQSTFINQYGRKIIQTESFTCMFEDYDEAFWLCINNQTGQKVKLANKLNTSH